MDLEFLKRKLGPFPMYVWIGVAVAAIVVYTRFIRNPTDKKTVSDGTFDGAPLDALVTSDSPIAPAATPAAQPDPDLPLGGNPFVAPVPNQPDISSNLEWQKTAIEFLTSSGISPVQAIRAITLYLSGKAVTGSDRTALEKAIRQLGPPPDGALPILDVTPATPKPPTPTPKPSGRTTIKVAHKGGLSIAEFVKNHKALLKSTANFKRLNPNLKSKPDSFKLPQGSLWYSS